MPRFSVIILLCLLSVCARADLVGGTTPDIPPPPDVIGGGNDNDRRIFRERTGIELQDDLVVDHVPTGLVFPNSFSEHVMLPSSFSPGIISSGTLINSYYFFIDPIEDEFATATLNWSVSFQGFDFGQSNIIGFIFLSSTLDTSDYLGSATTAYPVGEGARGLEAGDSFTATLEGGAITGVSITLDGSDPFDAVRIIELANPVPIPGAFFLLLSGLFGAQFMRRSL